MSGATNAGKTWTWGVEAAEESINTLIERRAKEAGDANHYAQAWAESARRYNLRAAAQRRQEWVEWHRAQAERHRATLTDLIAHHEAAAAELGAGDPDG